ncbi:MAG: DNA-directed RNA polymerase subunit K [Methanobacteriota archaeon]|nr:MAG: DNA-directed RNA polymerase subunit K [Euryarchaeota archaeon]
MKLTRFEKAKIVGARALQISMGAPILIKVPDDIIDPIDIAIKELEAGVVPITVRRKPPKKREEIPMDRGKSK